MPGLRSAARRSWAALLLAMCAALFVHCAAAQNNSLSFEPPRGTVLNTLTNTQANAVLATLGYTQPPFIGTVYEIITTQPVQLVRTYVYDPSDPFNASGRWTMRALNLRGLTPAQVKDLYALPTAVDHVTIVQVPAGTHLYYGIANPLPGWGSGGGPQIFLFDRPPLGNYQPQAVLDATTFYYAPRSGGGNAGHVGSYLDIRLPTPYSDLEGVFLTLDTLNLSNAGSLQSALNQLSGEAHTALMAAAGHAAQDVSRILLERLQAPCGAAAAQRVVQASAAGTAVGMPSATTANCDNNAWAQLIGNWGRVGDDGGASGYDYRTRGILLGRDFGERDHDWGIAGGYTQTQVGFDRNADRGTVDNVQLALYGASAHERLRLRGVAGFAYNHNNAERHLPFLGRNATASYNGYAVHGALELGLHDTRANAGVEPYASLSGMVVRNDGFTEQGAGDVDLVAAKATLRSLQAGVGVRLSAAGSAAGGTELEPRFTAGWSHEFMDSAPSSDMRFAATTGTFPVNGAAIGRDALTLAASVGARVRKNVTIHIGARAEVRSNFAQYGAVAGLVAQW